MTACERYEQAKDELLDLHRVKSQLEAMYRAKLAECAALRLEADLPEPTCIIYPARHLRVGNGR